MEDVFTGFIWSSFEIPSTLAVSESIYSVYGNWGIVRYQAKSHLDET